MFSGLGCYKILHKRFCYKYLNIYTLLISLSNCYNSIPFLRKKDKIWDMSQTNIIYEYNIIISPLKSRENIRKKKSRPKTVQFQILKI